MTWKCAKTMIKMCSLLPLVVSTFVKSELTIYFNLVAYIRNDNIFYQEAKVNVIKFGVNRQLVFVLHHV